MKVDNPFESGRIKNYILLYTGVVVIVVLFFFASILFQNNEKQIEKKSFNTNISTIKKVQSAEKTTYPKEKKFKLLNKTY